MADTSQTADSQEKLFFLEENEAYDFYIGKRAGGKILSSIKDAKKSIRIISPFMNKSTIDLLYDKYVKEKLHDISMITCLKDSDLEITKWSKEDWKIPALDCLISIKKEGDKYNCNPVFNTIFLKGDYIHEKLFLVDDITYTGSINFTGKGMYKNHETCITIKNSDITKRLYGYFNTFASSNYSRWDINELGEKIDIAKENIKKKIQERKEWKK
jgi:hypothetical protein